MKKLLLCSAVALFGALQAQQTKFGLKGGYALSTIQSDELDNIFDNGDISVNNNAKSGFYVGAFVEHQLNEKFALQGEVQYANLGGQIEAKYNDGSTNFTILDKINFNQIVVPVSAKYFVTPQFALLAGPSVAFSTGYKSDIQIKNSNIPAELRSEVNSSLGDLENQQNKALEDELKSTGFNIFFGGEYQFYKSLSIDARYTVGLTNYEKNPVDGSKTTMNYLQLGLGYKF